MHGFKFPKGISLGDNKATEESSKHLGFKDKHSFTIIFYISMVTLLVVIVGFVW